jgi:cellulose synthase/poly-beta-1,6-N-acetylglucosamine synthase-like glycosyltransferase
MYENLASSFCQEYPRFEIIFSVAQSSDPAIDVVLDLMKKYPHVDARLMIGKSSTTLSLSLSPSSVYPSSLLLFFSLPLQVLHTPAAICNKGTIMERVFELVEKKNTNRQRALQSTEKNEEQQS